MIGRDFFLGEAFAFFRRRNTRNQSFGGLGSFGKSLAHKIKNDWNYCLRKPSVTLVSRDPRFFHLKGKTVGLVDAADLRIAIAGAEQPPSWLKP